jgi:hypothetical protein
MSKVIPDVKRTFPRASKAASKNRMIPRNRNSTPNETRAAPISRERERERKRVNSIQREKKGPRSEYESILRIFLCKALLSPPSDSILIDRLYSLC